MQEKHTQWLARLVVALVVLAFFGAFMDRVWANFLSFTPRVMSGEGKSAAKCLSSPEGRACQWTGWKSWHQLAPLCSQVACMKSVRGRNYALKRFGSNNTALIAVGVNTGENMRGDIWTGFDGESFHCVDATIFPSPIEAYFRGDDRETYVVRSDHELCAAAMNIPSIEVLRKEIEIVEMKHSPASVPSSTRDLE